MHLNEQSRNHCWHALRPHRKSSCSHVFECRNKDDEVLYTLCRQWAGRFGE